MLHQQVDLSLAELQEMMNRQQMQIRTSEQIILAKEQRLRLLRQQLSRASITSSGGGIQRDEAVLRQLETIKRVMESHRLQTATKSISPPMADLDLIKQFCADKESELYSMMNIIHQRPARSETQPRQLAKAELDKIRQELIIRNRLNEQQAQKICEQRQKLVQRQHELVRVNRELFELSESVQHQHQSPYGRLQLDVEKVQPSVVNSVKRRSSFGDVDLVNDEMDRIEIRETQSHDDTLSNENSLEELMARTSFIRAEDDDDDKTIVQHKTREPSPVPPAQLEEPSAKSSSKSGGKRVTFRPMDILLDAAAEGDIQLVIETALRMDDAGRPNEGGITALHNAVCTGNTEVARFLIKYGTDVNSADHDGWTPLHCAASCNNIEIANLLIESGSCVFSKTYGDDEMPIDKCDSAESGYEECVAYLRQIMAGIGRELNDGFVYAVYDYDPGQPDELQIRIGDRVRVIDRSDFCDDDEEASLDESDSLGDADNSGKCEESKRVSMWWMVENDHGARGLVPCNFLGLCKRTETSKCEK